MQAVIHAVDSTGAAIAFQTEDMKLAKLLQLVPAVKAALVEAGYVIVDGTPAGPTATPVPPLPLTFEVAQIVASTDSGQVYWRVRGGDFHKWGVPVYPEVLEAAGLGDIDPLAEGWWEPGVIAHYTLKENGKPKKVVRLERTSGR